MLSGRGSVRAAEKKKSGALQQYILLSMSSDGRCYLAEWQRERAGSGKKVSGEIQQYTLLPMSEGVRLRLFSEHLEGLEENDARTSVYSSYLPLS